VLQRVIDDLSYLIGTEQPVPEWVRADLKRITEYLK
jgi:hypothetical protein